MQVLAGKFPFTASTDPGVQLQGLFTIAQFPFVTPLVGGRHQFVQSVIVHRRYLHIVNESVVPLFYCSLNKSRRIMSIDLELKLDQRETR